MVKTIWAVACLASVPGICFAVVSGCGMTKTQIQEFGKMDVGEGPRQVLKQLTELQKEPAGQRVQAPPPFVASSTATGGTVFDPSVYPSRDLSASRASGVTPDAPPAVTPMGSPPMLVQTNAQEPISRHEPPIPAPETTRRSAVPPAEPTPKRTPAPVIVSSSPPVPGASPPPSAPPSQSSRPMANAAVPAAGPSHNPPPQDIASGRVQARPQSAGPSVPPAANYPAQRREVPPTVVAQETASSPPRGNQASAVSPPPDPGSSARSPAPPANVVAEVEDYSGGPRYKVGPEDVLRISVWGNKELSMDTVVRPDGKISMPLIQDVQAEGLTTSELSNVIHQKLLDYVKDPVVSVIVKEVNAPKFFIIGYVTRPGTYPLRGDMSVLQALSLAGGFSQFASPKKIRLVRSKGGEQEIRIINYYDLIETGEGNYLMKAGDTIVVP